MFRWKDSEYFVARYIYRLNYWLIQFCNLLNPDGAGGAKRSWIFSLPNAKHTIAQLPFEYTSTTTQLALASIRSPRGLVSYSLYYVHTNDNETADRIERSRWMQLASPSCDDDDDGWTTGDRSKGTVKQPRMHGSLAHSLRINWLKRGHLIILLN